MRKISDILRLHEAGLSIRQIAASLRIGRTAVSNTLGRAKAAGITWPLAENLDEARLHERLYGRSSSSQRPLPDWNRVHKEMKRKGVMLILLWEEYKSAYPDGYQYSRFCELYRTWRQKLDVTMRQDHKAGEKLFVDYAGPTMDVIDPETGQVRPAQIFVATLGASNYTYVEATWTQSLEDWMGSHRCAFEFFGGVPEILVPDNLKAGVSKPHLGVSRPGGFHPHWLGCAISASSRSMSSTQRLPSSSRPTTSALSRSWKARVAPSSKQ